MCGPVIGIIGAVASSAGSMIGAGAQADAQNKQADYYDRQAELRRQQGVFDSEKENRQRTKLRGQQQNIISNSGLEQENFAEVIESSERESELDIQAIRWGAEREASSLNEQAEIKRAEASATETGGMIGAISPLIGGIGKAVTMGGF